MLAILAVLAWSLLAAEGRLPNDVKPLSYRLQLNITNDGLEPPTNYTGTVDIALNFTAPTSNIILHASTGLKIKNVTLIMFVYQQRIDMKASFERNEMNDTLRVILDNEIVPSSMISYTLRLEFDGITSLDNQGFYRMEYKDPDDPRKKRYLASTQFESVSARTAFPCFDEPKFRAKFKLEIELNPNWHAVSNMPLALFTVTNVASVRQIYEFAESPPMPTYLFAWYVADATFGELASATVNGVRYGIHGRRSLQNQTAYALQEAPKIINELGSWLNISYTKTGMDKLDLVGLPEFNAGAMENWGFVTFREAYLFYHENHSSILNKRKTQMIIAHELAHQWFGDAVTLDWWSYTWLNEAFARLFQYMVPAEASSKLFLTDVKQLSMASDTWNSHPLSNTNVDSEESIDAMFDVITYGKGASILFMFGTAVRADPPESQMRNWLHRYLTERITSGGVAKPENLWDALNDPSLVEKFKPWTEIAGHSVVVVERTGSNNSTLRLSHVKETMHGNRTAIDLDLPIKAIAMGKNLVYDHSQMSVVGNISDSPIVIMGAQWIRPNSTMELKLNSSAGYYALIDSFGYYRVLYDENNWKALKRQLTEELTNNITETLLSPDERANLASDSLNLMLSGYMDSILAMDFIEFLKHERSMFVWKAALMALDGIRGFLKGDPEALVNFDSKVRRLIEAGVKINLKDVTAPLSETDEEISKMYVINRSCKYRTDNCTELMANIGGNWTQLEEYDKIFDGAILCKYASAATGNWENLLGAYEKSNVPTQQTRYLESLACTSDDKLQSKLVNMVTRQDINNIVAAVCEAPNGIKVVTNHLSMTLGTPGKYNKKTFKKLLNAVADNIKSQSDYDQFNNLLKKAVISLGDMEISAIRKSAQDAISLKELVAGRIRKGLNMQDAPYAPFAPGLGSATRPDDALIMCMIVALTICIISPFLVQKL
ncbi:Hypothetical protein NTJ_08274 [Nesidiocoris tenuis]|uniref:Aminopeptidase n=1 Tax=Nesidiocoris tenuis TaxID=355587 RepID=A0ABN7ATF0_9HEMI|nr:Hypothetical protein NTJ_08274 [Nesidiocoris tenuis]